MLIQICSPWKMKEGQIESPNPLHQKKLHSESPCLLEFKKMKNARFKSSFRS